MSKASSSASSSDVVNDKKMVQLADRGTWDSKLEFLLSCIGYAVGLGNVWRFPYLAFKNGGGTFLIPYLIMLVFCGLPLYLAETSLGQFSSVSPTRAFNGMPILKGVGFAMLFVSLQVAPYYNIILSWTMYYLYQSVYAVFTGTIPWKDCKPEWDTCYTRERMENCKNLKQLNDTASLARFGSECSNYDHRQTSVELFYEKQVIGLDRFSHMEGNNGSKLLNIASLGSVQPHLALTLFLAWGVIAISILRGVKSTGKTMYFTATFPYLVLTVLLIKGLTLEGAGKGIAYFILPDFSKILRVEIWKDAASQIFYSLSVSWGGLLTLASYNPFRNSLYRDTYVVVCANSATSVYAGFAIFAYIGYMSEQLNANIQDIVASGPGLAFQVWPEAMTLLSSNARLCAFFAMIFFMMLFSLGLSTMVVTVETVVSGILDIFPMLREKRVYVMSALISCLYLVGLPMICQNGLFWFQVFDDHSSSYPVIVSALLEVVGISYIYGLNRMANDIKMMTSKRLPLFFECCWKYVTPCCMGVILISTLIRVPGIEGLDGYVPSNTKWFGVQYFYAKYHYALVSYLVFFPIACMTGCAVRELYKNDWNWLEACSPTRHWGPISDDDRCNFQSEREDDISYQPHHLVGQELETSCLKINPC